MYCVNPKVWHCSQKNHQNLTAITAAILPNSTPPFPSLSPYKNSTKNTNPVPVLSSQVTGSSSSSQSLDAFGSQEWFKKSTPDIPIHRSTVQVHWVGRVDPKTPNFWGGKICWKPGKSMVKCLGTHCSTHLLRWDFGLRSKVAKSWKVPTKIFVGIRFGARFLHKTYLQFVAI